MTGKRNPVLLELRAELSGERIVLRPFRDDDAPALWEAVKLLTRLAFDLLRAERAEIRCDALNLRSAAIPRRLGFVQEATLRCARRNVDDKLGDTLLFALTRADAGMLHA